MVDESQSLPQEHLTPQEAFAALGSEHRIRIIEELGKRQSKDPRIPDEQVPFSDLLEATGIPDKGKFNYHLGKLTGIFVDRRENGYTLTHAGREVVRAVRAGTLTSQPESDETPIEGVSCPYCGSEAIWFSYDQGMIMFGCGVCAGYSLDDPIETPGIIQGGRFPASGLVGRDAEELYYLAPLWGMFVHRLLSEGLCPSCSGPVTAHIDICSDHPEEGICDTCESDHAGAIRYGCTVCGYAEGMPLWGRGLVGEEMFRFAYDRGVNLNRPSPDDLRLTRNIAEEVISVTPPRVRYTYHIDGDALSLTIDDSLEITDVKTEAPADESRG